MRKLGIQFAAVLDEFGNSTELAYTGWPDRIYLIDGQGKVAYKSKPGPFGFKPGELATALSRVTMAQQQTTARLKRKTTWHSWMNRRAEEYQAER